MRGGLEGLAVGRAGPWRHDIMLTCGEGKLEGGPARRGVRPAPAPFPPPIRPPPSPPSLLTLPTLTRVELCMGHKLECTCARARAAIQNCARGASGLAGRCRAWRRVHRRKEDLRCCNAGLKLFTCCQVAAPARSCSLFAVQKRNSMKSTCINKFLCIAAGCIDAHVHVRMHNMGCSCMNCVKGRYA